MLTNATHNQVRLEGVSLKASKLRRGVAALIALVLVSVPSVIAAGGVGQSRAVQTVRGSDAESKAFRAWMELIVNEEWARAADMLENFIDVYPKSRDAGAALYWLAFVQKKQGQLQLADQTLVRLIEEFPNSAWTIDARALRVGLAASNDALVAEAAREVANGEAQIIALEKLSRQEPDQAIDILSGLIKPGSSVARSLKEAAIDLLALSDSARAASALAEVARTEEDTRIRKRAIFSLGQSNDESILSLLERIAKENPETEVGNAALFALSQHKSERAVSVLGEASRNSGSPRTRRLVLLWLGARPGDAAVEELQRLYGASADFGTRQQTVLALFRHGGARSDDALFKIARSDESPEMRKEAIAWLGRREDDQVLNGLASLYDEEKSEDLKGRLLMTFAQSGQDAALKKLVDVAKSDASVHLRTRARFWLSRSVNPNAAKFLEGLPR